MVLIIYSPSMLSMILNDNVLLPFLTMTSIQHVLQKVFLKNASSNSCTTSKRSSAYKQEYCEYSEHTFSKLRLGEQLLLLLVVEFKLLDLKKTEIPYNIYYIANHFLLRIRLSNRWKTIPNQSIIPVSNILCFMLYMTPSRCRASFTFTFTHTILLDFFRFLGFQSELFGGCSFFQVGLGGE